MPILRTMRLLSLLASLAFSVTHVVADNNSALGQEAHKEPLLSEKLTVRELHFIAALDGYQVTTQEKAALLIAKADHLTCLATSQLYLQPVEVVFSAYSLEVKHCRLLPKP